MARKRGATPELTPPADSCPCEAWIPASIMEGYACGNPACRRTAPAKASFDAFVEDLVARREAAADPRATL